jgi:hypothetical protein
MTILAALLDKGLMHQVSTPPPTSAPKQPLFQCVQRVPSWV